MTELYKSKWNPLDGMTGMASFTPSHGWSILIEPAYTGSNIVYVHMS